MGRCGLTAFKRGGEKKVWPADHRNVQRGITVGVQRRRKGGKKGKKT